MAYQFSAPTMGAVNIGTYTTVAPGVANLPSTIYEPQLGEIRSGYDLTLKSWAEFIYLKIPTSTTITKNLLYWWTDNFSVAVLPVLSTSKNTGHAVAAAVTSLTSDSTNVNYGWFQISGLATILKTAVAATPDVVVYASATAGRIKILTSAGGQITGMRTANVATISAGVSTVTCYLSRPAMQGQIT
jgi:hypothetical protein